MNVFTFGLLLSTAIWSLIFDFRLMKMFSIVVGIYVIFDIYFRFRGYTSVRKKMSIATWNDTGDPTAHGCIEIDLTAADDLINKYNLQNPENRLSYTHIALKALGHATDDSFNNFGTLCFGSYIPAQSMDLSVFVELYENQTATIIIRDCKNLSITEIARQLKQKIDYLKNKKGSSFKLQLRLLDYIPTFIVQIIFNTLSFLSYNLGISIPLLDIKPNQFGYAVVVNAGKLGISNIYVPLTNFTKSIMVAVINAPYDKPVIVNNEVMIRKYIDICVTFDHRFADGSDGAKMIKRMEDVWINPKKYL